MSDYVARPAHGVAWVTGASAGIGRALCVELARRGWTIAATARRETELRDLAASTPGLAGRVVPFPGDVVDGPGLAALVARIEAELGPVALGVLNAGTYRPVSGVPLDPAAFHDTFAVNVGGTVNALVPLVEAMRQRRRGQIALVGSAAGYGGLPLIAAYGASKAAIIAMAEALRFELAPAGIRVTLVSPAFIDTRMTRENAVPLPAGLAVDEAAERIAEGLGRPGFEISFPRRNTYLLKLLNMLPYGLYFPLAQRIAARLGTKAVGARAS